MNTATQIGVFDGIDAETYHASPGVSNSMLSAMADCPQRCYALYLDPNRPPRDSTDAMLAGTLAHCAILEPDKLQQRYIVRPYGTDGRTAAGKAWLASVPLNVTTINHEQLNVAADQYAAVHSTPELAALLSSGHAERSVYWIDEATGQLCRCRPDWVHELPDGRVDIVDLKTAADASPDGFSKAIGRYGYHRQAAHYIAGYEQASGRKVRRFVFGVVSSVHPFIAAVYVLDDETMAQGIDEVAELLSRYAECVKTGEWPGYGPGLIVTGLPTWARRNMEMAVGYVGYV